jgi:hypothetical protein
MSNASRLARSGRRQRQDSERLIGSLELHGEHGHHDHPPGPDDGSETVGGDDFKKLRSVAGGSVGQVRVKRRSQADERIGNGLEEECEDHDEASAAANGSHTCLQRRFQQAFGLDEQGNGEDPV